MAKIRNVKKLEEAVDTLEEAMDLVNDAIMLEDNEIRGPEDFYTKLYEISEQIQDMIDESQK